MHRRETIRIIYNSDRTNNKNLFSYCRTAYHNMIRYGKNSYQNTPPLFLSSFLLPDIRVFHCPCYPFMPDDTNICDGKPRNSAIDDVIFPMIERTSLRRGISRIIAVIDIHDCLFHELPYPCIQVSIPFCTTQLRIYNCCSSRTMLMVSWATTAPPTWRHLHCKPPN